MRLYITLIVLIFISAGKLVSQSFPFNTDSIKLNISEETKKDINKARFFAEIHNDIIGCALNNLKEKDINYNRKNMKAELSECLKNNFLTFFVSESDSSNKSKFKNLSGLFEDFSPERLEYLTSKVQSPMIDSMGDELLPKDLEDYENILNSIDTSYFKKSYKVDDTTFIIRKHNELYFKVDKDKTLNNQERFFLIYKIVIHKYDLLLWTHYKDFRYQFRYD